MRARPSIWIAALCGFALLIGATGDAKADRRVALVVGNSHYSNASLFLANPKNDAEDVAAALRGVGFEVLQAINANKRELDLSMAKFARLATDADAALFYYAGHAVQYQGRNFLMPTDAEVEDEISFRYQMTPLDDVRAALDRGDGVKIVILDACRNNPIVNALRRKRTNGNRSVDAVRGGLAKIDKAQGMVVAYSTAADEVAADGDGRNSPFTAAFLKRLKEPGLEIEQLFRRVAADVNSLTGGRQRPETYVSLLSNYYLNQTDRIAFDKIKDSPDPAVLQDFIARFPTSSYVAEAQGRIQRIELAIRERQLLIARQQEAARLAEEQRAKLAAEKERKEREAAQLQEEQRTKLAADRARKERETQQEEQRAKLAVEQARKEREARQQEEQRAKLAAEQARRQRDAQLQEEVRAKLAAERERREREAAQRVLEEQQRTKVASVERQEPGNSALAGRPTENRTASPTQNAPTTAEQPCDRDGAMLARLRSNPSREGVVQFERSLTCEKLRPQVLRLQESLSVANAAPIVTNQIAREPAKLLTVEKIVPPPVLVAPPSAPVPAPKQEASPKPPEQVANAGDQKAPVVATDPVLACKQDEGRLSRIRANPSLADLVKLERELGCERLRPQIVRLRESLARADQATVASPSAPSVPTDTKQPPSGAVVQVPSCDQDRATLARLRASQSREEVVRFERELGCEQLRPQLLRLKESLSGG